MYTTGSLGFMLQGVSQQPQRVQPDGHVIEQINMQSDPNTGLSSRPGSEQALITSTLGADLAHNTVAAGNDLYRISTGNGTVAMIGYDGTVFTINDPNNYKGYFGKNMAYYAQDERIFCVNRDTIVQANSVNPQVITGWGHVSVLGGEFSRRYNLTISYDDGTSAYGEYITPDADAAGAAAAVRPSNIINNLVSNINAHPSRKSTTAIESLNGEQILIREFGPNFSVRADDEAGNTIVKSGKARVTTFADVPKYAPHRAVMRVTGDRGTLNDDTWLIFISDVTTTLGEGRGFSGVWQETVAPSDAEEFNRATMPHALDISGNTVTIVRPEWENRRIGNKQINPTPSFVGFPIKDIAGFQGRIAMIAGPNAIMSRTDNNLDFYRRTATTVLATDPIDIRSAGEDDSIMEWLIPYDKNLIVAAQDGQFFISGGVSMTSSNAAMPRSSTFEMAVGARPVVSGQTVMLPYNARAFSGLNEMLPTEEGTANTIESVNNVTRRYIRGDITGMSASANANTVVVQTDNDLRTIFVYNFLWENNSKVQSAWHTWKMPDPIEHLYVRDSTVFVWTRSGSNTYLLLLKLDRPVETSIGFHITGDYIISVNTTTEIRLPRNDYLFLGLENGTVYRAGNTITPISVALDGADYVYVLPDGVPTQVMAGVPVPVELRPNRAVASDWRGNKKFNDTLIVQKYQIDYENTGSIEVHMESPYTGNTILADSRVVPADDDPLDDFQTAVRDGTLEVPWGEDTKLAQLVVKSSGLQPVTIVEIRWAGQIFKGRL